MKLSQMASDLEQPWLGHLRTSQENQCFKEYLGLSLPFLPSLACRASKADLPKNANETQKLGRLEARALRAQGPTRMLQPGRSALNGFGGPEYYSLCETYHMVCSDNAWYV